MIFFFRQVSIRESLDSHEDELLEDLASYSNELEVKETKQIDFTFTFRPPNPWPFCHLDFPQFETKITQDTTFLLYMLHCTVMDQNLELSVQPQMREKSNKCNQCDFASSYASTLKTHLETHSREKSNKCNQCGYASSRASHLKAHMK